MENEIKWEQMSNNEILLEQISIQNKYQKIKDEMLELLEKMDKLTESYEQSIKELRKRKYII